MATYPIHLQYSTEHEWIAVDGASGRVGITEHAQAELGDIVFVELPEIGTTVTQGANFGVVESVKAVSDLYAPASGKVVDVNGELETRPELVNEDPYGKGWMIVIALSDPSELHALLDAGAYTAMVENRE